MILISALKKRGFPYTWQHKNAKLVGGGLLDPSKTVFKDAA